MVKYKRVFIALAIVLSGVSILPAWATPWPDFNWQKFADAYQNPTEVPFPTATPKDEAILLLPDLVVIGMRIETESGGGQCSNSLEPLGVRVWVMNMGDANAGPFLVGVNDARKSLDGLASEMSQSLWFEGYWNGKPNLAIVDVKDQVKESNEDNNRASEMLPVPTPVPTCTPPPPKNKIPDKPNPTAEAVD